MCSAGSGRSTRPWLCRRGWAACEGPSDRPVYLDLRTGLRHVAQVLAGARCARPGLPRPQGWPPPRPTSCAGGAAPLIDGTSQRGGLSPCSPTCAGVLATLTPAAAAVKRTFVRPGSDARAVEPAALRGALCAHGAASDRPRVSGVAPRQRVSEAHLEQREVVRGASDCGGDLGEPGGDA